MYGNLQVLTVAILNNLINRLEVEENAAYIQMIEKVENDLKVYENYFSTKSITKITVGNCDVCD